MKELRWLHIFYNIFTHGIATAIILVLLNPEQKGQSVDIKYDIVGQKLLNLEE